MIERYDVDGTRSEKSRDRSQWITPQQVLRSLILKRSRWDFRELRERIADGYTLRQSRISTASRCQSTVLSTVL